MEFNKVYNPLAHLCSDDDYVRNEIVECRKLMGTIGTNLNRLYEVVAFVYLYCSEKMLNIVYTTMLEIEMRKEYIFINPRKK